MKNNNTIEKMDKRVGESLRAIVPRIKTNLKKMEKIAKQATYNLRITIGRDLTQARRIVDQENKVTWTQWLENNFHLSSTTAHDYMLAAKGSRKFTNITEAIRHGRPTYALPRQSVGDIENETAGKKILSGISTGIFIERTLTESKEKQLKKKMALELVDAGYRALSIKAHSDKGGSDEAMRRLSEVRTVLKDAIEDDDIYF